MQLKICPIEISFYRTSIGKKWTLTILRDLILGFNQFSQILRNNPGLSSKVLSQRLKQLQKEFVIEKVIVNDSPIEIQYKLTERGIDLNRVLYELSLYGAKYYPEDVFGESEVTYEEMVEFFGRGFRISSDHITFDKSHPHVVSLEENPVGS